MSLLRGALRPKALGLQGQQHAKVVAGPELVLWQQSQCENMGKRLKRIAKELEKELERFEKD